MATRQTGRKTAAKPAAGASASRGAGPTARPASTAKAAAVSSRGPRWWRAALRWAGGGVPLSALVVSVAGLADSVYLTIQHFTESTSFGACPENSTINCVKVTTSPWSYLPAGPVSWSVPVSVAGLAFFVFMVLVNSPWGWRARWPAVHWARLVSVSVGMALVLYLVWAELFRIDAICLYCTGVHALTFILFALVVSKVTFSGVKPVPGTR